MSMTVQCPNPKCGMSSQVPPAHLGRVARCRQCGTRFTLAAATLAAAVGETIGDPPSTPGEESLTRIGRFEIRERLGAGAFGTVYHAYDPQLDREVALKLPHPGSLDSDTARQRFLREARAAARLRHPHIVPVYDAGQDGGHDYIAAAYIEGRPLAAALEEGRIPPQRAAAMVRDLAEALAYAHAQGVVHRDVKPANVLLDADSKPHLLDFGLARQQQEAERLTQEGAVLGTPSYMAPEQASGQHGEPLPASDQYALGIVLYELLTGQTPFTGPVQILLYHAVHTEPPRPRGLRAGLPVDLETICLKALAKRPADRYPSCQDLADDLRRWLDGAPIHARRLGPLESLTRWCRREPVLALSSGTAALCLLIAAGVATASFQKYRERAWTATEARTLAEEGQERATAARLQAEEDERQANERFQEAEQKGKEARAALAKRVQAERDEEEARQKAEAAQKQLAQALEQLNTANKEETEALAKRRELSAVVQGLLRETANIPKQAFILGAGARLGVILSRDGRQLAFAKGGQIHVWDVNRGREAHVLTGHTDNVTTVVFHPDGGRLASTGRNQTIRVWDLALAREVFSIKDKQAFRIALAYSPDGRLLASSDGGSLEAPAAAIKLWDANNGKERAKLPGHSKSIDALAFSPDGKRLASLSQDGTVRLWDVAARREMSRFPSVMTGVYPCVLAEVNTLLFSPDGSLLLAQGDGITSSRGIAFAGIKRTKRMEDGTLLLVEDGALKLARGAGVTAWAVPDGKVVVSLPGPAGMSPEGRVYTPLPRPAGLAPDGSGFVVVNAQESGILLYDTVARKAIRISVSTRDVTAVAITSDRSRLLTVTASGLARVWDVTALTKKTESPSLR